MYCRKVGESIGFIIAEDNEAVIKFCHKARPDALKHLLRTHRVAVDWIFGVCENNRNPLVAVNT